MNATAEPMTPQPFAHTNQGGESERALRRKWVDPESLAEYSRRRPSRWLLAAGFDWAVMLLTMLLCNLYPQPWVWLLGIVVIGTRQHALGILAHDAAHFLVTRSKPWNAILGNALAGYPMTYPVQGYRTNHLEHHRHLETERDPEQATVNLYPAEWNFPMSKPRLLMLMIRDLIGGSLLPLMALSRYLWTMKTSAVPHVLAIVALHGAAFTAALLTGYLWTYLLLWVVPMFTTTLLCFRIRTCAEHSGIHPPQMRYRFRDVDTLAVTRTTYYPLLTRFLFGPHNISYHLEHHMFPSVPFFNLPRLHRHLMGNAEYASKARITGGFGGLFAELTDARLGAAPSKEAAAGT